MRNAFPRTTVEGVSLSRMIIGTNWILGWSHRGPAADGQIRARFPDGASAVPLLRTFLDAGVDTIMGPLQQESVMQAAVRETMQATGREMIFLEQKSRSDAPSRHAIRPLRSFRKCAVSAAAAVSALSVFVPPRS